MIFLLVLLNTIYTENRIDIKTLAPSTIYMDIEFSHFNQIEHRPITKFIISKTPPTYEYKITKIDSSVMSDKNTNTNMSPIKIGTAIKIKNCTVYPVIIYPSYLNQNINIYCKSIEITVNYTPDFNKLNLSPALGKVFKNLILNYQFNDYGKPQSYLIITPDAFYNDVLPLADWKEKKGWHVTVATLSQTGSSPSEIKNYISNFYNSSNPQLEYVLLIGDVAQLPQYSSVAPVRTTDYPYSLIQGNDFLAEVIIGRLPATSTTELNTIVAKIIGYEKDPYMNEPLWFKRALMVAANYPIDTMTTPIPTKRWVKDKLFEYGFNTVDTVYYPPTSGGAAITNSINAGVLFVNYRGGIADLQGWVYPSYYNDSIIGLTNDWKLPIVTSITCYTGEFQVGTCFGEAWLRAGNPANPKGAVAFFGASAAMTSSRWNNCLDYGIYWGILKEHIYNLGPALYRGKMEVFLNFPLDTTWAYGSSFYFHTYNLLGDPSLEVWTGIPDTFVVSHVSSIPVGTNHFSIQVENSASQAVENALVSLYKDGEVKELEFTDGAGQAHFNFSTTTEDTLFVTVTKHNFKPYCGFCLVNNSTVYVGHENHTISDPAGNNNGEVNPGETIEMQITLKNYGTSTTATNVSAKLTTTDPLVAITDSTKSYGTISPGGTATASPYIFNVSTNAKNSHVIKFNLEITSSQGNWNSSVWITVKAPEFVYQRHQILDGGNAVLEPGENSDMTVSIKNCGNLTADNISGILKSWNPGVNVIDSIGSFGSIPAGDSATNNSDYFRVSALSSLSPGHQIGFSVFISGDNDFKDTIDFKIIIGIVDQSKPLGPDDYGYFAYDDTDAGYAERPTYNWVEIDPELSGPGDTLYLENDETKTINLPFNFKYYGNSYNRVSICSNGYIAMDSTWIADMYNWHIPAAGGPPLLIAPFWDDLDPNVTDTSGSVCYWFDSSNHQFIIEYSRVQRINDPTNPTPAELESFEAILFDPQYYSTKTGDGEILFQYKDIANTDSCHNYATVGIENKEHTTGLEYTYANIYPPAAAHLANVRAIKFTTDPPDTFPGVEENDQITAPTSIIEIYPNPFSQIVDIRLQMTDDRLEMAAARLQLKVYDVTGRLVKTFSPLLSDIGYRSSVIWDGTDNNGKRLPEGVYFIRLKTSNFNDVKKVILLK